MARYKHYDYSQGKFIPLSFDKQILPGTFEYTLHYLIDNEIDLSVFDLRYQNDETGASAYDPAILLKTSSTLTLGESPPAARSSNAAGKMWFSWPCQPTRSHTSPQSPISSPLDQEIVKLFLEVLLICDEMGLIGKEMFAVDGCKLPSNASKEWSGTKADLQKKKAKMEKAIQQIMARHREMDKTEANKAVIEQEEQYATTLKEKVKKIKDWLKDNDDKPGSGNKPRKNNVTDNESAAMKTSHGVIQGYNGVTMVDSKHQVVVIGVGNKPTDYNETDVEIAQSLGQLSWEIFERIKAVDELQKAHAKVERRTQELAATNKELEAFTYSVSHDLRAPLNWVSGFSQILYEGYANKLDSQGREYLARIKNGSDRMSQLIEDLLRLSHISRQNVERMDYDLSSLASVVVNSLREAAPARNVDVVIAEGLRAFVDPNLMNIALTNLFNNAWKFSSKSENARIEFGVTEKDTKTVYFIRDNGAGFDPTYAEKMFLPFQRLHSEKEFEGTGIGLAIVERIIRHHEGRVWAEGEVGKGATIYFTLGQ